MLLDGKWHGDSLCPVQQRKILPPFWKLKHNSPYLTATVPSVALNNLGGGISSSMKIFFSGFAVASLIGLLYTHELRGDRNAARSAFEMQKDNIKSNYIVGWHTGFQVGANSGMNSIGLAMASNQGTNALDFVRSNVFWDFNLYRPK